MVNVSYYFIYLLIHFASSRFSFFCHTTILYSNIAGISIMLIFYIYIIQHKKHQRKGKIIFRMGHIHPLDSSLLLHYESIMWLLAFYCKITPSAILLTLDDMPFQQCRLVLQTARSSNNYTSLPFKFKQFPF